MLRRKKEPQEPTAGEHRSFQGVPAKPSPEKGLKQGAGSELSAAMQVLKDLRWVQAKPALNLECLPCWALLRTSLR